MKLQGRLGNQMFQYALAKQLQYLGKKVKIDNSQLQYDNNKNELGIFAVDMDEATPEEVKKYGDCNKNLINKVLRHTIGYKKSHYLEQGMEFHPEVFTLDEKYIDGYWQTEKYFKEIENDIRALYQFPEDDNKLNIETKEKMAATNSVAMHIRRGDYLNREVMQLYGNPCDEQYYQKAIAYFVEKCKDTNFFVFTNDKEWVRDNFKVASQMIFVDWNNGKNSFRDMELMSCCKHNVIANSSFSWWSAWLNRNKEKLVVAPKVWFENISTPDIWCNGWIRM